MNVIEMVDKYNLKPRGVIQVGSHHGEEHCVWLQMGLKYIVHFEPIQSNFDRLNEALAIYDEEGKWDGDRLVMKLALGNSRKTVVMNTETVNGAQSCSILEPKSHKLIFPWITFDGKEEVLMCRLDDLGVSDGANFMYVDAQGYELEIFKGAKETLRFMDFIFTEVNRGEVYEGCGQIEELDQFLGSLGFRRVETEWHGGEFGDALYVR